MNLSLVSIALLFLAAGSPVAPHAHAAPKQSAKLAHTKLSTLEAAAKTRTTVKARVALESSDADVVDEADNLEQANSGRFPNYLRALAVRPGAPKAFAHLVKSVYHDGTVEPEVKMGMGLRVAQLNTSPYVAAHLTRLLRASARGRAILSTIGSGKFDSMDPRDRLALQYADWLSPDVNGVSDSDYRTVRGYFNDAEIVELTLTVCFFDYFTRFAEGLNLPLEPWVLDSPARPSTTTYERPMARVPVIYNEQFALINLEHPALKRMSTRSAPGLGLNIANSERAMLWCPNIPQAWWAYGQTVRQSATLPREIMLQVSFAVSMANGCRYCILHQVLGFKRIGVSPAKLLAMRKDDSVLTPRELNAVTFARKLTSQPGSITDGDYQKLLAEFGVPGAMDILLQTCTFAFMNHFTDVLRMPSEDVAVQAYREVYGTDLNRPEGRR